MHDKRRYKRFQLNGREVNGKMVLATEVKVVDISVSGISLKTSRRLNIGSAYTLKLEAAETISLRGTVVWCSLIEIRKITEGEMVPIYSAGMQFNDMSAERTTELQNFIEKHKIEAVHAVGGTRLGIRFHVKAPENAILIYPDDYDVKTISLGGMLIECGRSFEIESRLPMEMFIRDDAPLEFVGRVASCKDIEVEGQKQYSIGIEFLDLKDKDREIIASFIERGGISDRETGNGPAATAVATAEEDFSVVSRDFIDKVEYLYKWHKTMGYYKVLDINEYATEEQIRHAFLSKSQELHPDKVPGASEALKQKLNELFSYLNAAHSTLMSPQKRREYDRKPITRMRR